MLRARRCRPALRSLRAGRSRRSPRMATMRFSRLARRWGLLRGTPRAPWPQCAVSPSPGTPVRALPPRQAAALARRQGGRWAATTGARLVAGEGLRRSRHLTIRQLISRVLDALGGSKCSRGLGGLFRAAARRRRPTVVVGSWHVSPSSIDPPSVMTVASRGFTSARCRGERPSRLRGLLGAPSIVVSPSVASHPTLRHCPRCAL